MLTSDGASVKLGRWNGLAALLKRTVPHLSEQHCVAHRENLTLIDSWKNNSLLKGIKVLLHTVYTLFNRSSVKTAAHAELTNGGTFFSTNLRSLLVITSFCCQNFC